MQSYRTSGITYFAQDPLRSYFDECQKNKIHFLIEQCSLCTLDYIVNSR